MCSPQTRVACKLFVSGAEASRFAMFVLEACARFWDLGHQAESFVVYPKCPKDPIIRYSVLG